LKLTVFLSLGKKLELAVGLVLALALIFWVLSWALPPMSPSDFHDQSLGLLRATAQAIKKEFRAVLQDQSEKLRKAARDPFPESTEGRFARFQSLHLDTSIEGVATYGQDGTLGLWLGNVLNLEEAVPEGIKVTTLQQFGQTLLIQSKASAYLVSFHWTSPQTLIVLYRVLAFIPQFKSPYLKEYHFLKPRLMKNCQINYVDFREDMSGFEKVFSRHKDEYIGEPKLQGEITSILFPLRNERNNIIANVNLRSSSLAASLFARKEGFLLVFYLFLAAALVLLNILFARSSLRGGGGWLILVAASLAGFRFVFLSLSRLQRFESWPLFSPAKAGFFSVGPLTKSPADIFLTALCIFVFGAVLSAFLLRANRRRATDPPNLRLTPVFILGFGLAVVFLMESQSLASRLALNSSLNLLRFHWSGTFIILHLSIVLTAGAGLLLIVAFLKRAAPHRGGAAALWASLLLVEGALYFALGRNRPLPFLLQAAALISLTAAVSLPPRLRRASLWAAVLLQILFIYGTLAEATSAKSRLLAENFIKETVLSQEHWARFIMDQSIQDLEKRRDILLAFLKSPDSALSSAHDLWDQTLAAKFNWYSSLEVLDPKGRTLSRFSLNVPEIFRAVASPVPSVQWTVSRLAIPFMGKEKDFLVGYKDWRGPGAELGRTVFYLSLDYDLLPFLYSANPYFELLRVNSLPSLNEFGFWFAVFDQSGNLLFNPNNISTGLPRTLTRPGVVDERGIWAAFTDWNSHFDLFAFRAENRIFAVLIPRKGVLRGTVEYLKLAIFYACLLVLPVAIVLLSVRKKVQPPWWSFSNRVYISFIVVALVPLFLFTIFSRTFFVRIFGQQFVEKAEIHAGMARSVMDDFIYFQKEEKTEIEAPPEDLVLWISTTISNDVNLYREGRLISSSRREFFDAGLFPDLLEGEIYYKIQFENNPFYVQQSRIGDFSFQTLTLPYVSFGPRLMISLPFPFEQEEISHASQDLIEFLLFISVFFIATVLILARGIGTMIITPIRKLLAGTKEASLGNLDFAIEYRSRDEMKTLIDGFNAMIASLKSHEKELADLSKKAAWAEMARKVAHEIKNPLTPIQLSAEHLLRVYEDRPTDFGRALKESISYIIGEVEILRRIAQDFLETSKDVALHKELFGFDALVRETVAPYKSMLAERIRFVEFVEGSGFSLEGDRDKLKICLRNLLTNAIESIRGKGEIRVRLSGSPEVLAVEIEDTGIGIEKDILDRIFEPYFSTKDVGTGLGLPIAKKIIEDHGGTIEISSEPGHGTRVVIRFRRAKP
jgi:signal transduction histidine kinase